MREKAVSGMLAAVYRRDTDMEEKEEKISLLKKVIIINFAFVLICLLMLKNRSLKIQREREKKGNN